MKKIKEKVLDKVFSKFIRERDGQCMKCGEINKKKLQCAHIFSRTARSVRWDEDNCITLCMKCHLYWAHTNPIEFTEFIRAHLGPELYNDLRTRAKQIKKWTNEEKEDLLNRYGTNK